jgi:hypothetical protein
MMDILLEKINNMEKILMEINMKIGNFLGTEDLSKFEKFKISLSI